MFRKSEASQQADFFGSFDFNFSSRKGRELNDPNSLVGSILQVCHLQN